jgi:hypothetical protein
MMCEQAGTRVMISAKLRTCPARAFRRGHGAIAIAIVGWVVIEGRRASLLLELDRAGLAPVPNEPRDSAAP